jgi:photosystem I reaction center subunit XII
MSTLKIFTSKKNFTLIINSIGYYNQCTNNKIINYYINIHMLSDSQILFALALAIMPSLLAVRLGTALND